MGRRANSSRARDARGVSARCVARCGEGRDGEIRRGMARCGEMWRDAARCGEMWRRERSRVPVSTHTHTAAPSRAAVPRRL